MSEEINLQTEDGQMLTAEYKDGQLQIVEVTPFDKNPESILSDLNTDDSDQNTYLQVLDTGVGKGLVHLDLLNITLVKCNDDDNSYQVVEGGSDDDNTATITCVLSGEDGDEGDGSQDSYVVVDTEEGQDPLVVLQSSLNKINNRNRSDETPPQNKDKKKQLTPAEILEKAKAIQRAKALLNSQTKVKKDEKGRKRKSDLPPPVELLSSPNFKLYLYSCKQCSFKCNAIKEMSQHKASEHGAGSRAGGRSAGTLQCARCPYRGNTHTQLMKHVQDSHVSQEEVPNTVKLNSLEVESADVLVCGACGFESGDRFVFKQHIVEEHGATATC